MVSPAADMEVGERLVRTLLAEQHPDLAGLPLIELSAGWDNSLWRLGTTMLVRLPRRNVAAPLTLNEQRWLPEIAPHLPLPVPVPLRVGRPSESYPWPWSVVPWLDGLPGDRAPITRPGETAGSLGRFLRALHQVAPRNAPQNPYRGVPLSRRASLFDERLAELASEVDGAAVRRVWDEAVQADPWSGPPTWLHGDLHPANTLVVNGTIAAVIDFGDMCAGDPATDLAAAWMLLPRSAMPAFLDSYGHVDVQLERRSLGWAVLFALMLLAIGLDDQPTYDPVGRSTLARVMEQTRARTDRGPSAEPNGDPHSTP